MVGNETNKQTKTQPQPQPHETTHTAWVLYAFGKGLAVSPGKAPLPTGLSYRTPVPLPTGHAAFLEALPDSQPRPEHLSFSRDLQKLKFQKSG